MNKVPPRKRFYIDGLPAKMSTEHAQYLKPVDELLTKTKERMTRPGEGGRLRQLTSRRTTEDGATLTAISGPHGDEIRIDVPSRPVHAQPEPPPPITDEPVKPKLAPHEPGYLVTNPVWTEHRQMGESVEPILNYEHHTAEGPPYSEEHRKDEPEEKSEKHPYLWVGVRLSSPSPYWESWASIPNNVDEWAFPEDIVVAVWEPWDKANNKPRGIVSSVVIPDYPGPEGGYGPDPNFGPRIKYDFEGLNPIPDGVRPLMALTKGLAAIFDGEGLVLTTENGLYMMPYRAYAGTIGMVTSVPVPQNPVSAYITTTHPNGPYDPLGTEYEKRIKNPDLTDPDDEYELEFPPWHNVTVLDPSPWLPPTDDREWADINGVLADLGVKPTVFPGKYVVKVAFDMICSGDPDNAAAFMPIEVEVRLGKMPNMVVKRFNFVVTKPSGWPRQLTPYGLYIPGPYFELGGVSPYMGGGNTHASGYWPGAIVIDVMAQTAKLYERYLPDHGFQDATPLDNHDFVPGEWNRSVADGCSGGEFNAMVFVASVYPESTMWEPNDNLATTFAHCVYYFGAWNPWVSPDWEIPVDGDPPADILIRYRDRALTDGVTIGTCYQWTGDPNNPATENPSFPESFVPVATGGVSIKSDAFMEVLKGIAAAAEYDYAILHVVGYNTRHISTEQAELP